MRTQTYDSDSIKKFLKKSKIATISELKTVLGTSVKMTVIRKLKKLGYYTSYSHCDQGFAFAPKPGFQNTPRLS